MTPPPAPLVLGGAAVAALAVAVLLLLLRRPRRNRFELIRRGKEQWEATFDAIAEGIALTDGRGTIRRANAALAALAGRPVADIVGETLCAALLGEPGLLTDLLAAAAAGARPAPVVRRPRGSPRALRFAATALPRPVDGATVVCVVADITEQQALEAQLIQSEKMAAVGTLVSGVAHELNNPLTSIAGLSEFLLEQGGTAAGEREHLRVIHEQSERAGRIVRDLLTFARQGPAERAPVDLGEVVERTVRLMSYELRRHAVTVETDVAPALPPIFGDRHQLQQVLLNLLGNAAQAMADLPPSRPRRASVRVAREEDRVVVRVADTGPGLSEAVRAQMFNPFFTTKAPGEGTGLGLFVSYGIAAAHGGTLAAETGAGARGATLLLSLPVAALAADRPAATPRRVLVVDDDAVARQVVSALLSGDGHQVDAVASGDEALRLAAAHRYDLIIADRLAATGGEPLPAALASLPPPGVGQLVISTSDVGRQSVDRLAAGRPVLRKPFDLMELKRTVEGVLQKADELRDAELRAVGNRESSDRGGDASAAP